MILACNSIKPDQLRTGSMISVFTAHTDDAAADVATFFEIIENMMSEGAMTDYTPRIRTLTVGGVGTFLIGTLKFCGDSYSIHGPNVAPDYELPSKYTQNT